MPDTQTRPTDAANPALPGHDVLIRVRNLIVTALVVGVVYTAFMSMGRVECQLGPDGEAVELCASMELRPSAFVSYALGFVVLHTITRIARRARDEDAAMRMLDRAAQLLVVIALGSIVIARTWYALTPMPDLAEPWAVWAPFPFGVIEVEVSQGAQLP